MKLLSTGLVCALGALALAPVALASGSTNNNNNNNNQQYFGHHAVQGAFRDWAESDLRAWLLHQGIVAPKSTKDELVMLADQSWADAQRAASSVGAGATSATSALSSSLASLSSAYASYASAAHERGTRDARRLYWSASALGASASESAARAYSSASPAASSLAASVLESASGSVHASTDWVWSAWSDNQLRQFLKKHGYAKDPSQAKRDELLAAVKDVYTKTVNAPYELFSDSYLHNWLVDHGVIRTPGQRARDEYLSLAQKYYYGAHDAVWDSWSDSEVRHWLIEHGVLTKQDADKTTPERARELLSGAYATTTEYLYRGWTDSDLRALLVAAGVLAPLRPGDLPSPRTRSEYVELLEAHARAWAEQSAYVVTWSDQHLRGFLASAGVALPDIESWSRERLLQETRSRLTEAAKGTNGFFFGALWRVREVAQHALSAFQRAAGDLKSSAADQSYSASKSASIASKSASRVSASASAKVSEALKKGKVDL